jgi:hypothetical protein
MTELFKKAVAAARDLPPDVQDEIARIVLTIATGEEPEPVVLSPAERKAIAAFERGGRAWRVCY